MASTWDLVGGNPAPGDTEAIRQYASAFRQISEEAGSCHEQLNAVRGQWESSDWSGPAADVFRSRIGTVVPDLGKASESYGTAATGLAQFASALEILHMDAQGALSRARSAQSRLSSANEAASGARQSAQAAADEQTRLSHEISVLGSEITMRQLALGSVAISDTTLRVWTADLRQLQIQQSQVEQMGRGAEHDAEVADEEALDARESLNLARGEIERIRGQYEKAVRRVRARLEDAAANGIRNVSFWERDFEKATSAFGHLVSGAVWDGERFSRDALIIESGHMSGFGDLVHWAEHDIVAAAPEIHALTEAWATLADGLASLVRDCGPYLPLICTVGGAIVGGVMGGVAGVAAGGIGAIPGAIAGAEEGADIGDAAAKVIPTMVDAEASEADFAEVGSDELMQMDGKGSQVNMADDSSDLKSNVDATAGDAVEDLVGIPGVNTVVEQSLSTGHVNVVKVITTLGEGEAGSLAANGVDGAIGLML